MLTCAELTVALCRTGELWLITGPELSMVYLIDSEDALCAVVSKCCVVAEWAAVRGG